MESNRIRIERATLGDAPPLAELARATFLATFESLFPGHESDLAAYLDRTFATRKLAASIRKPANRYWLAHDGADAVGYAKLKLGSAHALCRGDNPAQLQKIYVCDRAKGSGVGRSLVEKVVEEARTDGADALWLSVHEANDRAVKFYARSGWRDVGADLFSIGSLQLDYRLIVFDLE